MEKLHRAYVSYGRNPIADTETLVRVAQNRKKWQGKPVCKLYKKKSVDKGSHFTRTFLVKAMMADGMTYEEAIKECC